MTLCCMMIYIYVLLQMIDHIRLEGRQAQQNIRAWRLVQRQLIRRLPGAKIS